MTNDDLIRRGVVIDRLDLAEHDAEERDWRSGANEIARLRKYVAALPAIDPTPVKPVEALQVPKVQALVEAVRTLLICPYYINTGMFAGVRPQNELAQLDWQDISLTNGLLTVTRTTSKTRRTRNVPIQPNLAAWLRSVPKSERTGKLFYSRRWMRRIVAAAKLDAKGRPAPFKMQEGKPIFERGAKLNAVKWGADVMRHSYCSYRNAVIKNIPQLCLEAGNTPDIAQAHYLNPRVTPAQVKAFWSIRPASVTESKKGN